MTAPLPVLYSFRRCPYAMRARMAIAVSGQTCALREVVLRDKPMEMLEASPKATVPVLVLSAGDVLEESYDIMKWALAANDPDGWLSPTQGRLEDIDALVQVNDGAFKHHLDRYKYPNRYADVDPLEEREKGVKILRALDDRIRDAGFLFGARVSLADAAIMPFVRQFAHTDKEWFDSLDLPNLQNWLRRGLDSPLFKRVMQKYPAWQSGDPEPLFP
jgi:glutathione S-transferase